MDGNVRIPAVAGGLDTSSGNPAAVREESHLEEMRSAIRGDFARLAERRGGDHEPVRVDAESEEHPLDEAPALEPEPAARRSWFARFVSP